MPNIKSAMKRVRTSAKQRARNRSARSQVSSVRASLLEAVEANDKARAQKLYSEYASELDKTAKKGIIAANNASRKKSRLAVRIAAMA